MSFKYDIALSFAGEDREYVDKVANELRDLRVSVFYDKFEEVNLWGKNLYDYLQDIYFRKCRYVVMFISEHYSNKLWTNEERKSSQARAFQCHNEYILPAKFDDTEIPGLLPTIGYISLKSKTPLEFASLIKQKVMMPQDSELKLIDFYPPLGSRITSNDIKKIYLKFNNPIVKGTEMYIRNYHIQANSSCQWNICGWVEFSEGNTLLKWHVKEELLKRDITSYGPLDYDYPRFNIQIGIKNSNSDIGVKDIYGNVYPYFEIPVKIIDDD